MQKQSPINEGKLGMGLTNGNGFTNGMASSQATRDISHHNGDAASSAEVNTYFTGLTNGNGLTVGEGATNGNGLTGKPNRIPLVKSKRLKSRLIGFAVAVILIVAPLSLYMIDIQESADGIVIDGDFRDWNGVLRHTDTVMDMSQHPNINIVESSVVVKDEKASVLLAVDGWMLEGGEDDMTDQVHILIDSDADQETGYQYDGLGAEYMVHVTGLDRSIDTNTIYVYDDVYRSTSERTQNDWNVWNPANNGYTAISGNKLEASVYLFKDLMNPEGTINVVFETRDHAGFSDRTDIVSNAPGYLVVNQQSLITDEVVESASNIESLRLVATANEAPIVVDKLSFTHSAEITVTTSPQLPMKLQAGESAEIIVEVDTTGIPSASALDIALSTVSAVNHESGYDVPVTVSGKGYAGYVDNAPTEIVIDGAFGDWANVEGHFDNMAEKSTNGNANIDIREYRTVESKESVSFYLRVDGTMMEGTRILSEPLKAVEKSIPSSGKSSMKRKLTDIISDEKFGYDYAYINVDLDCDKSTGYNTFGLIGAEYMIRIVGQSGTIISQELYKFSRNVDNPWVLVGDIEAANDAKRLETQITAELLNIEGIDSVDYYIMMTDWSSGKDTAADPRLGEQGGAGTLNVAKLGDKTVVEMQPKLSNSRNPHTTRTSSRAVINGLQTGTVTLNDGDELGGDIYGDFTLIIPKGVTVYIFQGIVANITATNIYVNGTIDGIGNGSTGGGAGTAGNNDAGNGNGNNFGNAGTWENNDGGSGGGGGGYGGAGGDGGNGAGVSANRFGTGGAEYVDNDDVISMGAGGGGGAASTHVGGGDGGDGGGAIRLTSTNIMSISGTITVNGTAGQDGVGTTIKNNDAGGGGGGGSGGGIFIWSKSSSASAFSITGQLFARGGNGGAGGNQTEATGGNNDGGGGGGGGSGGRIKIYHNGTFTNSSTITYGGGAAGAFGTGGASGADGSAGSVGGLGSLKVELIPEFLTIAIPISLTMIVFFGLRRRGGRARGDKASSQEVVL